MSSLKRYVSFGSLAQLFRKPQSLILIPKYLNQLWHYRKLERKVFHPLPPLRLYPCLADAIKEQTVGHYFYQNCWAAKQVFSYKPAYVTDIGSSVELVGILSQFCPCISVDIRPLKTQLSGLLGCSASILDLPFADNSVEFLTTMCVLEHIGLGRYGDPLDPKGTYSAVREIARVTAPGGIVVYSVPIGRNVLEFNAHRRFTLQDASTLFERWTILDYTVLAPHPISYEVNQGYLAQEFSDPVGCFSVRKPGL
jgi:hypothetical protein